MPNLRINLLKDLYHVEEVRYLQTGREVHMKYIPTNMSGYGLAVGICNGPNWHVYNTGINIFIQEMVRRYDRFIDDVLERQQLYETKPKREQIRVFKKRVAAFKKVLGANIQKIIRPYFRRKNKIPPKIKGKVMRFISTNSLEQPNLSKSAKKRLNQDIFNGMMQDTIMHLAYSPGFNAIVDEYIHVQEVAADSSRFSELEKLCRSALMSFMINKRINAWDYDEQYQEGLLVVWACAKKYEGRNFARFSSMVRTGLNNKFKNMLRYISADKRKIIGKTSPAGSASHPGDSWLARRMDKMVYRAWDDMQRQVAAADDEENSEFLRRLAHFAYAQVTGGEDSAELVDWVRKNNLGRAFTEHPPGGVKIYDTKAIEAGIRFLAEHPKDLQAILRNHNAGLPFAGIDFLDYLHPGSPRWEELAIIDDGTWDGIEVDDDNFPHMNELKICHKDRDDVLRRRSWAKSREVAARIYEEGYSGIQDLDELEEIERMLRAAEVQREERKRLKAELGELDVF